MTDNISVLIADDHPLFRKGLKEVIQGLKSVAALHEAGDGKTALQIIEDQSPTLAVLDIDMPGMGGLEVAETIRQRELPTDVIILTMYDKETLFNRALDLGVMGYVLKDGAVGEIVQCIASVLEGKHYISPSLSNFLVRRSGREPGGKEQKLGLSGLTQMERKVLSLIAEHKTTNDIAKHLFISPRTVETHRHNICKKLGIHGTNALLKFAFENSSLL